jgi:hypothetical protein
MIDDDWLRWLTDDGWSTDDVLLKDWLMTNDWWWLTDDNWLMMTNDWWWLSDEDWQTDDDWLIMIDRLMDDDHADNNHVHDNWKSAVIVSNIIH